jgi:hypothetical protein
VPPWQGEAGEVLAPLVRRLLEYMHDRDHVQTDDLDRHGWGKEVVTSTALNTALSRANRFLNEQGYPHLLRRVRGQPVVCWVWGPV